MVFAWACYPARSVSLFLSRRRSEAARWGWLPSSRRSPAGTSASWPACPHAP